MKTKLILKHYQEIEYPQEIIDDSELQNLEDNIKRILWVTICDCKEQETTWAYLGE